MMTPAERKRLKLERDTLQRIATLQILVIIACGVVLAMDPHTAWGESRVSDWAGLIASATFAGLLITDSYKSKLPDL